MRLVVSLLLAVSVLTDLKAYKIKNAILLPGLVAGILYQGFTNGAKGIGLGVLSMLIPFCILYPFYLLKTFGAGDIKLMSCVSMFMLPMESVRFFIVTFFVGGALAVIKMILSKNGRERLQYLFQYMKNCFLFRKLLPYQEHLPQQQDSKKMVIHFSIPIAISAVSWMVGLI